MNIIPSKYDNFLSTLNYDNNDNVMYVPAQVSMDGRGGTELHVNTQIVNTSLAILTHSTWDTWLSTPIYPLTKFINKNEMCLAFRCIIEKGDILKNTY